MKKCIFLISLASVLLYSCDKSDDSAMVYLSIKNETPLPLELVSIYLEGTTHSYGTINTGQTSDTFLFRNSYVADSITFEYNSKLGIVKPSDALFQWAGMEAGATYRYVIHLDENERFQYSVGKVN
ncbi:hypothetical protein [uncultured Roseivirga sp.]|uniref:hypothetical protein n=1 Tax=uncultured Roseivirga sp. TaxID=543088 RepID=UPI0030DC68A4|tara:strand:- start:2261 stop:2638 length:378 start_codon:yes stop_codon:yes gene_type:complete